MISIPVKLPSITSYVGALVGIAAFYYLAGSLSFSLSVSHGIVTQVVFFAEGGALAAAILMGPRIWPGIFAGQFILAYTNGLGLEPAAVISAINSAEAVIGTTLFRAMGLSHKLRKLRDVALLLFLITTILQPFSASLGIAALWFFDNIQTADVYSSWISWWSGNSLGQIIVTPFLLVFFSRLHWPCNHRELAYDIATTVFAATSIYFLIFGFRGMNIIGPVEILAVIMSLVTVVAVLRGQVVATATVIIASVVILLGIQLSVSAFSGNHRPAWIELNIVLCAMVLLSQFAAVIFEERKRERKKLRDNQKLLRGVVENSPLAVVIRDKKGCFVYVNKVYEDLFKIEMKNIVGKTLEQVYPHQLAAQLHGYDQRLLAGEKLIAEEHNIDEKIYLYTVRFSIRDDGQNVTHIVGVSTNITDYKLIEAQLRQSQKMEVVGQLSGGIAHDFNNLLSVMLGNAELLGDRVAGDQKSIKYITAIKKAINRASSLTSRLLAFSRQQDLSPVSTDITDLINGLEDMLKHFLGSAVVLNIKTRPDLWPATIDRNQFEDALINLAINARDAMAINAGDAMAHGGTLTIETANVVFDKTRAEQHEEMTPGDYVEVSVSDTGSGIAPEDLEKVFEPFFTTKGVGEGSGLGLSMVYGFAKQSMGHVAIVSGQGHGTTVKLYIPRSNGIAADDVTQVP